MMLVTVISKSWSAFREKNIHWVNLGKFYCFLFDTSNALYCRPTCSRNFHMD